MDIFAANPTLFRGKIHRFGSNVDTDAIIPAEFMPGKNDEDLGTHCFEYFRPEFRRKGSLQKHSQSTVGR